MILAFVSSSSSSKKKSLKEAIEEDQNEDNDKVDTTHLYADNLSGDIYTETNANPKAKVHSTEWMKILHGDPVEINPRCPHGF